MGKIYLECYYINIYMHVPVQIFNKDKAKPNTF